MNSEIFDEKIVIFQNFLVRKNTFWFIFSIFFGKLKENERFLWIFFNKTLKIENFLEKIDNYAYNKALKGP